MRTQNARRVTTVQPQTTQQYFSQYGSAQAFHPTTTVAPPVVVQPPPQPQAIIIPTQQVPAVQHARPPAQPVQAYAPPQQYQYGWLHDPLYYSAVASPPPMRPQLPGESFGERVVKNVGLAMLESLFLQAFMAVRQLVLPPVPASDLEPRDVTPNHRS